MKTDRAAWVVALMAAAGLPARAEDGFTIALKGTLQFDIVALADGSLPPGARISDGGTFRRMRIGVAGQLSENWSYEFSPRLDAATSLRYIPIGNAFLQYDGRLCT